MSPSNLPSYTVFGTSTSSISAVVPTGQTVDVGARIELNGNARILLGSGGGGRAVVLLGSASGRSRMGTFNPADDSSAPNSAVRNYNCVLNWRRQGALPLNPPCTNDVVQFPNDGNGYWAATYGQRSGAVSVGLQQSGIPTLRQCPQSGLNVLSVGPVVVSVPNCRSTFQWRRGTCNTDFAQSIRDCGGGTTFYSTVSGTTALTGLITTGPYAGQAFQQSGSFSLRNVTSAVMTDPQGSYTIGNATVSNSGQVAAVSASGGSDDSGSSLIIIVVVAIAAVLIIGIIVYVVKKNGGDKGTDSRGPAVSFENPMYDTDPSAMSASEAAPADGGLYSEPGFADNGDASGYMDVNHDGEADGYMDVPGENNGGASGYMDVQPDSGVSGYMDVHADDDGDDI